MTEDDYTFETVKVEIRRNADNVVRVYEDKYWLSDFIWSEGNYACDCNRHLFFERAGEGVEPLNDPNFSNDCSDGRYSVRIKDLNGELLYQDGDWEQNNV